MLGQHSDLKVWIAGSSPPSLDPFVSVDSYHHLRGDQATTAVKCCTQLLSCPLDPDTLHSNLRLCLRLTRTPEQAAVFAREGGPQALLALTHKSGFRGFASLVTLLFKHCLEDGPVLRQAMESMIRASVTSPYFNSKEVRPQAMGGRELYYVMRKLGPCACRNPRLFMELATSTVRLCSEPPASSVYTSTQRMPTTLVKCVPPSKSEHVPLNVVQMDLINLLLDHLCAEEEPPEEDDEGKAGLEEKATESKMEEEREIPAMHFDDSRRGRVRRGSYRRQLTAGTYDDDDVNSEDMAVDGEEAGGAGSRIASSLGGATASNSPTGDRDAAGTNGKSEKSRHQPLMSKAAILRLLSELVETYSSCARLIAESSRKVKVHGNPAKDMTVLAFVFDYLLPASSNSSGKVPPIAKLSKTFIQCLAVSHSSPEIISLLVTEFKQALMRALTLPESTFKHNRIRALTGLLSQISDYITAARGALNPSHFARLLIRKGFISDLARAIHCLNLSSPMLSGTVNSILKPLEVLTKIVNQVAAASKKAEDKGGAVPGAGAGVSGRGQVEDGAQPQQQQQREEQSHEQGADGGQGSSRVSVVVEGGDGGGSGTGGVAGGAESGEATLNEVSADGGAVPPPQVSAPSRGMYYMYTSCMYISAPSRGICMYVCIMHVHFVQCNLNIRRPVILS